MNISKFSEICGEFNFLSRILKCAGIDSDSKVENLVKNIEIKRADLNLLDAKNKNGTEIKRKFHVVIKGEKGIYTRRVADDDSIGYYVMEIVKVIPVYVVEIREENGEYTIFVYKQVAMLSPESWNSYATVSQIN